MSDTQTAARQAQLDREFLNELGLLDATRQTLDRMIEDDVRRPGVVDGNAIRRARALRQALDALVIVYLEGA